MKVKEKSEKVGLKLNIQKTKIMASGLITSWQIYREAVKTMTDFLFWGFKITADADCSHEVKRCLLLGRKVMTNLDSILKNRDITLPAKVHLVKALVFQVVMYGCDSWTIKKAECRRIDAFELWCWRRLLRVPWTARRSNQSILNEITPEHSLESVLPNNVKDWCWTWSYSTLATWFEELTPWKRPWCWGRLKAGGEGDDRRWDGWMVSLTQWTWAKQTPGVGNGQRSLVCCNPWGLKESDMTERLNWTELPQACHSRGLLQGLNSLFTLFPLLPSHLLLIKEPGNQALARWLFWDTILLSSWSASSWIKSLLSLLRVP